MAPSWTSLVHKVYLWGHLVALDSTLCFVVREETLILIIIRELTN